MALIRRVPLGAKLAIGLVFGAVLLWSIGWFYAASEGRHAFELWRTNTAASGATFRLTTPELERENCREQHDEKNEKEPFELVYHVELP